MNCLHCGREFGPDCLPVITGQIVIWCEHCDPYLNLSTKIGMVTEKLNAWRLAKPGQYDYDSIEDESHRAIEKGLTFCRGKSPLTSS